MLYILDTDTCSYILRKNPGKVLEAMDATVQQGHEIAVSAITYAELMLGAKRSGNPAKHVALITELCERLHDIYAWDARAAEQYADLQTWLFSQGMPIGTNDSLIAAHVLSLGATLVTNNTKHFAKVPALRIVNWTSSELESARP
ncbi:MAG: type II toxin-antitoxin system VapC family toxin [Methylococcales bacterium]